MSKQEQALSKDSTIYSYKLMKRMYHSIFKIVPYFIVLLLILIYKIDVQDWLPLLLGYPIIIIFHMLLVRAFFQYTIGSAMRGWSFRPGIFWCGILPEGHASIKLVSKVQLNLFWIGLAFIALLYPWIPAIWILDLILFHTWVLMPRLWMLYRFRPYRQSGLIKITRKDTSCFIQ
ncbi:hypothetical protein [Paenibacillus hexagrammi]|uniref:Transposase n=1 Tax=Paenibacillus hexagrammi TaxID=2908839 RepID=A0ABY3SJ24_9BACL|nr:hypothetical protein [Paenibacillus sp. YPD9-1]UJF33145.1 hypothetical protein L0M14_26975 [Paenibacillus sp. YPD9-1]